MENEIQPQQVKALHLLLNRTRLIHQKAALVSSFTKGRSESSRDMTDTEADGLIAWLKAQSATGNPLDRQRKLIIHYAHQMRWELPSGKADMERINSWCLKYGQFHKPLNEHNATEMPRLVTQFEGVYKSFLKSV